LATRTDSTYSSGGYIGTWLFNSGGTGKLDDFGGGSLGAPGFRAYDYSLFPKPKLRRVAV
jgi:hypothetical protein